jgi:hypothetical protein
MAFRFENACMSQWRLLICDVVPGGHHAMVHYPQPRQKKRPQRCTPNLGFLCVVAHPPAFSLWALMAWTLQNMKAMQTHRFKVQP